MTHQINLLPWRKMKRSRAKKIRAVCVVVGLIVAGVMVFLHHQTVSIHTINKAVDSNSDRKKREQFNAQIRKTMAKAEQQSLDSLHFIGLLKDGLKTWGLISEPDGLVSIVIPGDYLGRDHGRIIQINDNRIEIEKSTWGKQGLEKKRVVMHLRA